MKLSVTTDMTEHRIASPALLGGNHEASAIIERQRLRRVGRQTQLGLGLPPPTAFLHRGGGGNVLARKAAGTVSRRLQYASKNQVDF